MKCPHKLSTSDLATLCRLASTSFLNAAFRSDRDLVKYFTYEAASAKKSAARSTRQRTEPLHKLTTSDLETLCRLAELALPTASEAESSLVGYLQHEVDSAREAVQQAAVDLYWARRRAGEERRRIGSPTCQRLKKYLAHRRRTAEQIAAALKSTPSKMYSCLARYEGTAFVRDKSVQPHVWTVLQDKALASTEKRKRK